MAERELIVAELKRALRERKLTYRDVARKLRLSQASVKRIFAAADLSLTRVDQICDLLDLSLTALLERAHERPVTAQLSLAQEQEIVSDPTLFLVTWLLLNRATLEEIVRDYTLSEREVLRLYFRLDRLRVIELLPGNRVRVLVNRHFSWRKDGPVQRFIHEKLLREFIAPGFTGSQEEFMFHGGELSAQALEEVRQVLRNASRLCAGIVEQDRGPREARRGVAYVLALRPWNYSGFSDYKRENLAKPRKLVPARRKSRSTRSSRR